MLRINIIHFFFFLEFLNFYSASAQDVSIYNPEKPVIVNLWNRVADQSSSLRAVEAAEISPNGKLAVSGAKFGYAVMLWRVADGALIWEKAHDSEVECVTFSPDGNRIATGAEDYSIRIWNTATGEVIHTIETERGLDGIAWSHDGKLIAGGTEAGDILIFDANDYRLLRKQNVGSTINSIHFTNDDSRVVVAGNIQSPNKQTGQTDYSGFAKLLDVKSLKTLNEYKGHTASIKSIRISPNQTMVATGSFDNSANLYELETGKLLNSFKESKRIEAVVFSADGNFLLTGGHNLKISFYRTSDYELVYELATPRTEYLDFTDDGRLLLTAHEDSGLLSIYMMVSDSGRIPGLYQKLSREILNNRDIQENLE
jgi:WD40 repeat protein